MVNKKPHQSEAFIFLIIVVASCKLATARGIGLSIDELVHMDGNVPQEVTIEDRSVSERVKLIQQLEEEDKRALFRIIDSMLTKSKFKDFFQKIVAAL